jgi:uncharacterized membrane-anchored protein
MRSLAVVTLLALLAAAIYYAVGIWTAVEAPDMPAAIYVALALGVLFSVVIGAGLMALMFYSSRQGYDDHASGRDRRL